MDTAVFCVRLSGKSYCGFLHFLVIVFFYLLHNIKDLFWSFQMEDQDHNSYLLFKKEQADQDHNVNKLDALSLIHPHVKVEEVVATSEAEKDASPDKPKGQN